MRDLLFAACWLVLLPVSLGSAYIGVLIWMWVAIFSPNDLLFGFMADVPFNKVIAVSTFGVLMFGPEKKDFYLDKTVVLLILLALLGTVSAFNSFVDVPDGWTLYSKLLKELTLTFLIMGLMSTRYRIHMAVFTICIAFGFEAVVEAGEYIVSAGTHKVLGVPSVGDNNSLAVEMLMSIPLLWYLNQYSAAKYTKIALIGVLVLSVVTVVATFSRGGFIGLLVLGLFFVAKSKNKIGGLVAVGVVGAVMVASVPSDYSSRLNTMDDLSDDMSFSGRINAWKISTAEALDSPLFGAGFHAVQRPEVWQHYRPAAEQMTIVETPPIGIVPHAAHSIYFEVLGDLGFVGLILFVSVIAVALSSTRAIKRLTRRRPNLSWAADLAQMMQISLIVYVVTAAALSMAYWEGFYIYVALVSRLHRTVQVAIKDETSRDVPRAATRATARAAARPAPVGVRRSAVRPSDVAPG